MDYTSEGYVDFEAFAPDLKKAEQQKKIVKNELCGEYYQGYWVFDNGMEYFLKVPNYYALDDEKIKKRIYTEILLEELAMNAGLNVIETKVALLDKKNHLLGMMSQSYLRDGYRICPGSEIVYDYLDFLENSKDPFTKKSPLKLYFQKNRVEDVLADNKNNYNSLEFVWASLLYHFRNSKNKLALVEAIMQKLTKRYIFQFLMMQQDYHLKNWEILETDNLAFLSPMYDLDMGFHDRFNSKRNNSMRSYMNPVDSVYEDFKRFYESSSTEIKEEVNKQLSLLTPEVILNCMMIIESKYRYTFPRDFKDTFLQKYTLHYDKLKELTKSYHL